MDSCLLEEIGVVDVSEEGHGVGQHPDITTSAVVIRFRPPAILVFHCQDFVLLPFRVHAFVQPIGVESWNREKPLNRSSLFLPEI